MTVTFYLCIVGILCPIITFYVLFLFSGIQFAFHWKPNHSGPDGYYVFRTKNLNIAKYWLWIASSELVYILGSVFSFSVSGGYWLLIVFSLAAVSMCIISCRRFNRTVEYDFLRKSKGIVPRDSKEHGFWSSMKGKTDKEILKINASDFTKILVVFLSIGYNLSIVLNYMVLVANE